MLLLAIPRGIRRSDQRATHRLHKSVVVLERLCSGLTWLVLLLFLLLFLQMHLSESCVLNSPSSVARHFFDRLVQDGRGVFDELFLGLFVQLLVGLGLHLVEDSFDGVGVEERVEEVIDVDDVALAGVIGASGCFVRGRIVSRHELQR